MVLYLVQSSGVGAKENLCFYNTEKRWPGRRDRKKVAGGIDSEEVDRITLISWGEASIRGLGGSSLVV